MPPLVLVIGATFYARLVGDNLQAMKAYEDKSIWHHLNPCWYIIILSTGVIKSTSRMEMGLCILGRHRNYPQ